MAPAPDRLRCLDLPASTRSSATARPTAAASTIAASRYLTCSSRRRRKLRRRPCCTMMKITIGLPRSQVNRCSGSLLEALCSVRLPSSALSAPRAAQLPARRLQQEVEDLGVRTRRQPSRPRFLRSRPGSAVRPSLRCVWVAPAGRCWSTRRRRRRRRPALSSETMSFRDLAPAAGPSWPDGPPLHARMFPVVRGGPCR